MPDENVCLNNFKLACFISFGFCNEWNLKILEYAKSIAFFIFGSIFLTCFSVSLITYLLVQKINIEIVLIAFFISVSSQLGDLFFSFLKRKAKIKDTGNILPGHGGILDRLDGIYLGLPIGYLILTLLT